MKNIMPSIYLDYNNENVDANEFIEKEKNMI